jgi:hypothetical protein
MRKGAGAKSVEGGRLRRRGAEHVGAVKTNCGARRNPEAPNGL